MDNHNNINIAEELSENIVVHKNLAPQVVLADLSQIKIILRDHTDAVKKSSDWISVTALLISLVIANITASFQSIWGLSADTWKAIFVILTAGSFIWLIVILINRYRLREKRSIDFIIKQIINESGSSD